MPGTAGKIVHDRFHIMKHVCEAVDRVRKQEHRELLGQEDHRLKGTKYLWLYRKQNLPDKYRPALEACNGYEPEGGQGLSHGGESERRLGIPEHRLGQAAPMRKVGGLIQRDLDNILTFCRHRNTNAVAEGLNSKILANKRKACGYRNRDHFKTAISFFCGGLDLCPVSS